VSSIFRVFRVKLKIKKIQTTLIIDIVMAIITMLLKKNFDILTNVSVEAGRES
jgi:hypothetical protein